MGWELQRKIAELRKRDLIEDTLLLLEHSPVITYGRNVGPGSLLFDHPSLAERGVELVETDRGGDATYHGPGQLVAYPILDLKVDLRDVRRYVWTLEEWMISVMAEYGVRGERVDGAPGAWVKANRTDEIDRKMGAVGVRLSRWVSHHGIGFNVNTDLAYFKLIIPCGLIDKGVTSLQRELFLSENTPHGCSDVKMHKGEGLLDFEHAQDHFIHHFARLFRRVPIERSPQALRDMIKTASESELSGI